MSNYTKATNFATKDTLPTGDSNKIVKGTEIDNEFNSISGAISSKADIASPTFTGTPAAPTATAGSNTSQLATTAFVTAALAAVYPIGSIYVNAAVSTNPATLLGFGTWTAFGAGRVMVGFDSSDALFDTLEETGGSKDAIVVSHSHTLVAGSTASAGAHQHFTFAESGSGTLSGSNSAAKIAGGGASIGNENYEYNINNGSGTASHGVTNSAGAHTHSLAGSTDSSGSSGTNANVQPYITVRMWKRTA
jgi:hypothetical protein